MSERIVWLPPIVQISDYGGNWEMYIDVLYDFFKADFVYSKPLFRGRTLRLKMHPMSEGREATFWHLISEGRDEASRIPDLRRCERIRWPRVLIEHSEDKSVKVWETIRGGEARVHMWLEEKDYLFVLADRKGYLLPWTAFLTNWPHTRRRLRKEFESWQTQQKTNAAPD